MTLMAGGERRRRWSEEERARILAAAEEPGAVVAEVARRADVCTSLIYQWRREARAGAKPAGFAELVLEDTRGPAVATSAPTREFKSDAIVVEMKEARIRIGGNASAALIAATLKALRS
jgi:transposase